MKKNIIQFDDINHASSGLGYNKPLRIYEKNIIQKTEQSLVSENTLSTNPCKLQYKYTFLEPFKTTIQKIAQYKHTRISVRLLCFSDEKTA